MDRTFITELVYGVLRQQGTLDWILNQRTHQPFSRLSPRIRNILRLGAYQILFLSRVPSAAAVNESVKLSKTLGGRPVGSLVNGILRSLVRDQCFNFPKVDSDPVEHIASCYSHPAWLVNRWVKRYGPEKTIEYCKESNEKALLTIRVNRNRTTVDELRKNLDEEGVSSRPTGLVSGGLHLDLSSSGKSIKALGSYRRGEFYVQDEAAQLVSLVMDPKPGERILDACAAPGGKSTHMAELMGNSGKVVALDISGERLKLVKENADRLSHSMIELRLGDASRVLSDFAESSFDRILVDAPCSALGLLRRNPEGRWKKTEEIIDYYKSIQKEILHHVSSLLKPKGVLVYSTCTTEPEENEEVVLPFVGSHPSFRLENIRVIWPDGFNEEAWEGGFLRTMFNKFRMDSFFIARMIKRS